MRQTAERFLLEALLNALAARDDTIMEDVEARLGSRLGSATADEHAGVEGAFDFIRTLRA